MADLETTPGWGHTFDVLLLVPRDEIPGTMEGDDWPPVYADMLEARVFAKLTMGNVDCSLVVTDATNAYLPEGDYGSDDKYIAVAVECAMHESQIDRVSALTNIFR